MKWKNLICFFKKAWNETRSYLFLCVIRNIFTALVSLTNSIGIGIIIHALTSGNTQKQIVLSILWYLAANLSINLINETLKLFENNAMRKASNTMQYEYMQDCIDIDYHFVQESNILNMKQRSMLGHPAFSINIYGECINNLLQILGVISIFAVLSPLFIQIILTISLFLILASLCVQKYEYKFKQEKVEDDRKLKYIYDVMTKYVYAKEIRINNAQYYFTNKYTEVFLRQVHKIKQLVSQKNCILLFNVLLSSIQLGIMYLYFTYQVCTARIDIGEYTILLASSTLLTKMILSIFSNIGLISNTLNAFEFYQEYKKTVNQNSIVRKGKTIVDWRSEKFDIGNSIKFENVSFIYPNSNEFVLKNINFEIQANQKVAIVGLNGSGKTTLIKLLLRLYSPTTGKITLDGVDISEIPYQIYTQQISTVLQDFYLFSYSIQENIIFDRPFCSHKLSECINKSGLSSKIGTLPKGMNTSVFRDLDDEGIEFSGGESQKLAIARAIYKNAQILVMDEPTSSLDAIAEYELFTRLYDISKSKTTIFISHRLSSTSFCDNIIVLDKGTIVEQGSHQRLLEQNGFYANLFSLQAKYYK